MTDLTELSARKVVALLQSAEISPFDALNAVEQRIERVDGSVNALPTRCFERARQNATKLMQKNSCERGLLAGLPVPIKDLTAVSGVRTSFGSKTRENFIPEQSDLLVENLENNGALIYAKSNTPEFGAGGNTFNDVFGMTRNPHNLALSAGGSSGGAAAALASGTAWLAHGSDLAGSLRTPASFCGVTSLRPSPGLFASGPSAAPFLVHPQQGPMARDIADLALFADAMAGGSSRAALSKPAHGPSFRDCASDAKRPARVAFSADLGLTETCETVLAVCKKAVACLSADGIAVENCHPDLQLAEQVFSAPRAMLYAALLGEDLEDIKDLIKPELVWNTEQGLALKGEEIRKSLVAQGTLFQQASQFMRDFDLLICPAAIIPPFPVEERYPGYDKGVPYKDYYRWLAIAYSITATTLPVITLPCGTTDDGLPIGLQLIGAPHSEKNMFSLASYIEQLLPKSICPVEPAAGRTASAQR